MGNCPKCGSTKTVKNGKRHGRQCYLCRECGRQFMMSKSEKETAEQNKRLAAILYWNYAMTRCWILGEIFGVSRTTISRWLASQDKKKVFDEEEIKRFAQEKQTELSKDTRAWEILNGIATGTLKAKRRKKFEDIQEALRRSKTRSFWYDFFA